MTRPVTSCSYSAAILIAVVAAASLISLVARVQAQNPSSPTPSGQDGLQAAPPIRVDVGLMLFEANVWDNNGNTMDNLRNGDFVLLDDGVPQSIAHFSRDELPLDIVFVVDESGSMSAVFEPLRQALLNSLVKLKTEDRVALFGFATDSKLATPFTKDKKAVARGVRGLRVGGSTQIYDALSQAATYMQKQAPQDRRIIVLISDDMPYPPQQESAAEKALRELQTTDVAVYKVRIAPALDIPALKVALQQLSALGVKVSVTIPETTEMPKQLTKIIEATGGVIADVNDLKGLPGAIDALVSLLKTRYTLGFYPNNAAGDTSYHKLDLRLTPGLGEKGKDYKILSKDGYYASPVH